MSLLKSGIPPGMKGKHLAIQITENSARFVSIKNDLVANDSTIDIHEFDEAKTKQVLLDDGWFKSGDLGKFEGHFLYILDRVKDIVIRGGENIACPEVEAAIYEHKDILEACVFGIPDERLGEILCAAIYLREGSTLSMEGLQSFLSSRLAAFKIPVNIQFMSVSLPKVGSGKFDKPNLRKLFIKNKNV